MELLSTTNVYEKLGVSYDRFHNICKKSNIKPVEKIWKNKFYENFYNFDEVLTAFIQDNRTIVITQTFHVYESKMNYINDL